MWVRKTRIKGCPTRFFLLKSSAHPTSVFGTWSRPNRAAERIPFVMRRKFVHNYSFNYCTYIFLPIDILPHQVRKTLWSDVITFALFLKNIYFLQQTLEVVCVLLRKVLRPRRVVAKIRRYIALAVIVITQAPIPSVKK